MPKKSTTLKTSIYLLLFSLLFPALTPVFASSGHYELQVTDQTKYVDKYFEVDQGGNTKTHIYLGDQNIADVVYDFTSSTEKIYYISRDHLYSASMITDEYGNIVELHDYYPFGAQNYQQIAKDPRTSQLFVGKESDPESLLYYYGARYYDQNTSRFISVDPFGQKLYDLNDDKLYAFLADPQRLNSYAYASNNPIGNIDVDGELTLKTLGHPGAAAAQLAFWHSSINAYMKPQGLNATAALLQHSLDWYPKDLNITSSNQAKYGNIIDQIKNSSEYKTAINTGVERATQSGRDYFDLRDIKELQHVIFSDKDLSLSIKKADFDKLSGRLENGRWYITAKVSDIYNFELHPTSEDYNGEWFTNSANNAAYTSQQLGIITPYGININFEDEIQ